MKKLGALLLIILLVGLGKGGNALILNTTPSSNPNVTAITKGGTGISTTPTDGQVLIGNTAQQGYNLANIVGTGGVTITNGPGTVSISVSGLARVATTGNAGDLIGLIGASQLPPLLGDVTSSAGSASVTVNRVGGVSFTTTPTSGNLLIGSGSGFISTAISGNVTINSSGVTIIGAAQVTNAMLAGSIDLTSKVVNALPAANGGSGQTSLVNSFTAFYETISTTLGDLVYGGASGAPTRLAGNSTATKKFLRETGTGSAATAPIWDTVVQADVGLGSVENTALSTWAGSTNITTLGTITSGTWHGTVIGASFLPTATNAALGLAECDGTTITCSAGVMTAVGGGGGSGTVASSSIGQVPVYTGATTVTGGANFTISAGALTLGVSGTAGSVKMGNATSGTITLQPVTGALGAVTVSIPAATDTLVNLAGTQTLTNKTLTAPVIATISNTGTLTLPTSSDTLIGKATTDTLTNKTFDTAGTGNSFKIAGTAITAVTGTGSAVLATSPTLVTPTLGAASASSIKVTSTSVPAGLMGMALFNDPLAVTNLPAIYENGAAVPVMTFTNDLAGATPKNYIACENGGNNTAPGCHIVSTDSETNVGFFMQPKGNAQFWITAVDSQTTVGATNSGIMLQNEDTTVGNTMAIYNVNANFSGTLNGQNAEIVFKNESQTQQTGSMYFMTANNGAPVTALTIDKNTNVTVNAGTFTVTAIASDATHTDRTVCEDTTSHTFFAGSGTAGVCLGTSSARYKNHIHSSPDGLNAIMQLRPVNFFYNKGFGDDGDHEQYGLLAEEMIGVLPKLVFIDKDGKPNSVDYMGLLMPLIRSVQQQQHEIDEIAGKPVFPFHKCFFNILVCAD